MQLTDREKEQIKAMIDAGRKLPARYKAMLFERPHEAELIWPGKTHEVTNVVLPFQSIEQIDEPRAGTPKGMPLFNLDDANGRQAGGWTNKLIWGDNKLVLASLKNGPLRREIEAAGGLKPRMPTATPSHTEPRYDGTISERRRFRIAATRAS